MKRMLAIIHIGGGNVWKAKVRAMDGQLFATTIHADRLTEALKKAMQTEPDAA